MLAYNKRGIVIPEPKEGLVYKGMGIQETQNCTVITLRMKYRRMRWSVRGANNLAKALYRKENRELIETIDRYTDGLVFTMQMQEIIETLSAAKAPKKDGKGNPYADRFIQKLNRDLGRSGKSQMCKESKISLFIFTVDVHLCSFGRAQRDSGNCI